MNHVNRIIQFCEKPSLLSFHRIDIKYQYFMHRVAQLCINKKIGDLEMCKQVIVFFIPTIYHINDILLEIYPYHNDLNIIRDVYLKSLYFMLNITPNGVYIDNKKHGVWKEYKIHNGNTYLSVSSVYHMGKLISKIKYNGGDEVHYNGKDGVVRRIGYSLDDIKLYEEYNNTIDNITRNTIILRYDNGNIKQITYTLSKLGMHRYAIYTKKMYDNKQLKATQQYEYDEKVGVWNKYYKRGDLKYTRTYPQPEEFHLISEIN
jgi:hypothetical protein